MSTRLGHSSCWAVHPIPIGPRGNEARTMALPAALVEQLADWISTGTWIQTTCCSRPARAPRSRGTPSAPAFTFGLGVRPSWRNYRLAVAVTALWAVTVMVFNSLVGTNYGYLNRKPADGTLLDLFGPWPGYVVVEIALVAGVWALTTWPWTRTAPGARKGCA